MNSKKEQLASQVPILASKCKRTMDKVSKIIFLTGASTFIFSLVLLLVAVGVHHQTGCSSGKVYTQLPLFSFMGDQKAVLSLSCPGVPTVFDKRGINSIYYEQPEPMDTDKETN